jgi:putative transposase
MSLSTKGMRQRNVGDGFDFCHLQDPQIGLPLVEPIKRIVVRTQILRPPAMLCLPKTPSVLKLQRLRALMRSCGITMSSLFVALVSLVASSCRTRAALQAEILALRHQLAVFQKNAPPSLRLQRSDRFLWVLLSRWWPGWRCSLHIVRPATVIAWHRRAFAWYWTRKSLRRTGRPHVPAEFRDLIRSMSQANPLWGAPRIHGELPKLGIEVAQSTVRKYLRRPRKPPSQTWRTLLTNHMAQMASIDFFLVATFRLLFVFVVLSHALRRVLHFQVTEHPSQEWTMQQMREAFPWDHGCGYLLRDRDAMYGGDLVAMTKGLGMEEMICAPRSPWQNPYVERLIGSVRRECLGPHHSVESKIVAPDPAKLLFLLPAFENTFSLPRTLQSRE